MRRLLWILLCLSLPLSARGFLVAQLNLEQLAVLSDRIVAGHCLEVKKGRDRNGRLVQYVTFAVEETLKGPEVDRLTFKQLLLESPEEREWFTTTTSFSQLPSYVVGEEAVLFLSSPSEIGLTAPIGLAQGKFVVTQGRDGKRLARNGLGNRGLFRGLKTSPKVKSLNLSSRERAQLQGRSGDLLDEDLRSWVKKLK